MLFKSYSLIVDEVHPDLAFMKRVAEQSIRRCNATSFSYRYHISLESERFLLLAVDVDDGKYSDTVFDTEAETEKQNPRKRYELEFADQFFACYDIQGKELYISSTQRRSALRLLFAEFIPPDRKVYIRERLTSVDDFAAVVQAIRRVKYTQTRNLVNLNPDGLFVQRYDPLGLEMPERLISTLEFGAGIRADSVINKLRTLFGNGSTNEIGSGWMAVHHGGKVGKAAKALASKSSSKSTKSKAGKALANHKAEKH